MGKSFKIMVLLLLLALLLVLTFVLGCGENDTSPKGDWVVTELSEQKLRQILDDSMLEFKEAETYRITMDINEWINGIKWRPPDWFDSLDC